MNLTDLITEEKKHDYCCAMLFFEFPKMKEFHSLINKNDIFFDDSDSSYGLEDEPHTTLLWGLHDNVKTEQIKEVIKLFEFGKYKLYNPSLFQNEGYDVLKFDVMGKNLHDINEKLKKLPHTSTYPDYHPHMTVGYLKPGKGKQYAEKLKKFKNIELIPTHVVYSKTDGSKDIIEINTK